LVPVKTVQAVAVIPLRTWLKGKIPPLEAGGPAEGAPLCVHDLSGASSTSDPIPIVAATVATRVQIAFGEVLTSIRVQPEGREPLSISFWQ